MNSEPLRQLYSEHLRGVLRKVIFGRARLSVVTRQDLLTSSPTFVGELWKYGQSESVELTEPTNVGGMAREIQRKVGTRLIDAPFVVQCSNIHLVGPDALPISPKGGYILEGVDGSTKRATDAIVRSLLSGVLPSRRATNSHYDVAVSLAGPWSDQFFHWFVEYLPRLLTVKMYTEQSSLEPMYLIPSSPPNWLSRSLELFDIPDDRIIEWSGGRLQVHNLLLPSLWRDTESTAPRQGYIHSPRGIREVSNQLLGSVSDEAAKTDIGTRLYISRSGEPTRDVVNENELQPVFDEYDFEVVRPETWSLDEQIATFANADVIAGPHGGGLTNSIYASNPTVMEFFGRNTNPCYFALFAGSGWDYGLVNGEAVGSDIRVNPDDFRQLCEQMLD